MIRPVLLVLVLAGCASTTEIKGPDGQTAHLVECANPASMAACYEAANNLCAAGYEVLSVERAPSERSLIVQCAAQ